VYHLEVEDMNSQVVCSSGTEKEKKRAHHENRKQTMRDVCDREAVRSGSRERKGGRELPLWIDRESTGKGKRGKKNWMTIPRMALTEINPLEDRGAIEAMLLGN